jgi:hypothetical protein
MKTVPQGEDETKDEEVRNTRMFNYTRARRGKNVITRAFTSSA